MPTQKPLREMIPEIVSHYRRHQDYLQFNLRVYRVLEGQVKLEVEDSLRKEILSHTALQRALQRIPSVNVLQKSTDKLSKVYVESPLRLADNDTDKDIMTNIVMESNMDNVLMTSNRIYNAQHTFALEPYVKDGKHALRVLAGHQFLPYSDDMEDPLKTTVFIKLLGNEVIEPENVGDDRGERKDEDKKIRLVDILALYSDDEFLIIDSSGSVRFDKMEKMGITSTKNPFGVIPFVIGNKSKFELVPFPNQSGFDISILIPKLLTDLNYAAQFMSHSIIWTKNADLSGQSINPDSVVDLGDSSAEDGSPEIGTIEPTVDIPNILSLIEFEMSSYFASVGIKTSVSGSMSPGKEESGVSKAIDSGDTSAELKKQTEFYRVIESKLWNLMSVVQRVWAKEGRLQSGEKRIFTDNFLPTFRMKFSEIKALKSHKQILDELKLAKDLGAVSRKQIIRTLNPDFTELQIKQVIDEIEEEAQESLENMMNAANPAGERDSSGQFGEGNESGSDQSPDTNLESRRGSN